MDNLKKTIFANIWDYEQAGVLNPAIDRDILLLTNFFKANSIQSSKKKTDKNSAPPPRWPNFFLGINFFSGGPGAPFFSREPRKKKQNKKIKQQINKKQEQVRKIQEIIGFRDHGGRHG